jgi:transcriptional regulator with XRE-family HTH domain
MSIYSRAIKKLGEAMAYSRAADKIMESMGKRMRASRIAAGYDEASMAAHDLGIEEQTYRKYERGESMPSPDKLEAISNLFDKSLDFLILGRSDRRPASTKDDRKD